MIGWMILTPVQPETPLTDLRLTNLRRQSTLFILLVSMIFFWQCSSPPKQEEPPSLPENWTVMQQEHFGGYEYQFGFITSTEGSNEHRFYLLHNGVPVIDYPCSEYTTLISAGEQGFLDSPTGKPSLIDLNGDGTLELIIQNYSGGAHCCYQYWIFSLGETPIQLAFLESKDSALIFMDKDNDGIFEIEGADKTFAYWQTDYATSPAPNFILTFSPNGIVLDTEKMRQPAPIESELENTIMRVRSELGKTISDHHDEAWRNAGIHPAVWATMLDLIYTGNGDLAWVFLDRVWRNGVRGKEEFRAAFTAKLQSSPYWDGIRVMNGWQ